jgi:phosphoadenosine phosphosulfate reductase
MSRLTVTDERRKELELKVQKSRDVVREAVREFSSRELAVGWTGGKDSTLTLFIVKQVCLEDKIPIPKAMFIEEGDTFPEIIDFVNEVSKKWNVDVEICMNKDVYDAGGGVLGGKVVVSKLSPRNQREVRERLELNIESFPFEAESFIGNHLMKTVPMNMFIEKNNIKGIFQGLRWDEQPARKQDEYFEFKEGGDLQPSHTRIRPILHFRERDVWDTTFAFGIPYVRLYEQGYRSLGAKTTSKKLSNVPAWEQDLEHTVERSGRRQDKEQMMERMRRLGYM